MTSATVFSRDRKGTQNSQKAANLAFSQRVQAASEKAATAEASRDIINITVECEESDIITDDGGEKYYACFNGILYTPKMHEVTINGPERDRKIEATKDADVLHKAFKLEGEAGVKRVAQRLERKQWLKSELDTNDDWTMEGLLDVKCDTKLTPTKLIPPGEGWTRFNDEMLWESRSGVYFVQSGKKAGQYLMPITGATGQFKEVDAPHKTTEVPVSARAGGASLVRKGAKQERTVLLPELPKIARLALKFPLSFVDSPASAFAIFQGVRSVEAADWCAKNFHTRLIPLLATKIHRWETKELQDGLGSVLKELDAELVRSSTPFSGCLAAVALLLGDRLVISGVGQVRAVLLFEDGTTRQLLTCMGDLSIERGGDLTAERERVEHARGVLHKAAGVSRLLYRVNEECDEANKILRARHVFDVLQLDIGQVDEKQVRTAYRKLALRVHPDKVPEDADKEAFNKAFSQLEKAKEAIETMLEIDNGKPCRELHRILRHEVHSRAGAAELLGVDKAASTDTEPLMAEAEKACRWLINSIDNLKGRSDDHAFAVAMCKEAVETIRRPNSAEALPRQEALLKIGIASSRVMGCRDLRVPSPIVQMEPQSASWIVSSTCRLAILCGATAALEDHRLIATTKTLKRHPKASALKWCQDADPAASSVGAICIGFDRKDEKKKDEGPAAKRQKTGLGGQQQAGSVFLRHILFRHQQLRYDDPMARRIGSAQNPAEAETAALAALEKLQVSPALFGKVCRDLSDCTSADQPGQLAGHLGWVCRGEQEATFDEAVFSLDLNEFGDIVTTNRGVHVIQRFG